MTDGSARLFLDGRQVAERRDFARPHATGGVFKIGSTATDFGGDFRGEIESVRFFDRSLEDETCRSLSRGEPGGLPEPAFQWPGKQGKKPPAAENPGPFAFHVAAAAAGETAGATWRIDEQRRIVLEIPPADEPRTIEVLRHAGGDTASLAAFLRHAGQHRRYAEQAPLHPGCGKPQHSRPRRHYPPTRAVSARRPHHH